MEADRRSGNVHAADEDVPSVAFQRFAEGRCLLRAAGQLLVTQVAGVLDLLFRLAGDLRKAKLGDQAKSLLGVIGLLLLAVAFGAEGVIALAPLFPAVGLGAIPAVVGVFDEGLSALFGGR